MIFEIENKNNTNMYMKFLKVPLFLGVLHQAVAVIILLSILKLKHSMMYK